MDKTGHLYIVATPIGHLKDITLRALDILNQVDLIAAEDTRHSKTLLQHYQINTPLISLHEHNEQQRCEELIIKLRAGKDIALISDAGTPLISDPGYYLVKTVRAADIHITPIPGPCAAIAALCIAGLPTDRFCFEGFLPAKSAMRKQILQGLLDEPRTLIFYESPHRIMDTLQDLADILSKERLVTIARELTKTFESVYSGTLQDIITQLMSDKNHQRGEFVVIVQGKPAQTDTLPSESIHILKTLLAELPVKQAAHLAAKITGKRKNSLYNLALELSNQE